MTSHKTDHNYLIFKYFKNDILKYIHTFTTDKGWNYIQLNFRIAEVSNLKINERQM